MGYLKKCRRIYLLLFLPAALLLTYLSSFYPNIIEKYYSGGLYQSIGPILSVVTGIFPFSVAELLMVILVIFLFGYIIRTLMRIVKLKVRRRLILFNSLFNILIFFSVVYFMFIIFWGLNYYRLPFAEIVGYDVQPASVDELANVCEDLIIRTNMLRDRVDENNEGVMQFSGETKDVFNRASIGYERAAVLFPQLDGRFGNPKRVLFSHQMSYTGITGVYFPFTGEANVNTAVPDSTLPFTACHEMAHQRGFAREDEANYIAYLTCMLHPDIDFQYSGMLGALVHTMNMLYNYDIDKYNQLRNGYSEGVKRDLKFVSLYWKQFEGPIENMSNNINDIYLKSNRQKEGVYSYNRMVDLLIAEYRMSHAGKNL